MLILASKSPRRAQILELLGVDFKVVEPFCEEDAFDTVELAKRKALSVSSKFPDDYVLGSDTLVFCGDEVLGKPKDREDAVQMLKKLRNKKHFVITGVALCKDNTVLFAESQKTEVNFRDYSDLEILNYILTMEYADKAGAYGAQGKGARFIDSINGCFYNIMGLPIAATLKALGKMEVF